MNFFRLTSCWLKLIFAFRELDLKRPKSSSLPLTGTCSKLPAKRTKREATRLSLLSLQKKLSNTEPHSIRHLADFSWLKLSLKLIRKLSKSCLRVSSLSARSTVLRAFTCLHRTTTWASCSGKKSLLPKLVHSIRKLCKSGRGSSWRRT